MGFGIASTQAMPAVRTVQSLLNVAQGALSWSSPTFQNKCFNLVLTEAGKSLETQLARTAFNGEGVLFGEVNGIAFEKSCDAVGFFFRYGADRTRPPYMIASDAFEAGQTAFRFTNPPGNPPHANLLLLQADKPDIRIFRQRPHTKKGAKQPTLYEHYLTVGFSQNFGRWMMLPEDATSEESVSHAEQNRILGALTECGWYTGRIAEAVQMKPDNLRDRLEKYGIAAPDRQETNLQTAINQKFARMIAAALRQTDGDNLRASRLLGMSLRALSYKTRELGALIDEADRRGDLPVTVVTLREVCETIEEEMIRNALKKTSGNRTEAAKILEISHKKLLYKIREYGIHIPASNDQ